MAAFLDYAATHDEPRFPLWRLLAMTGLRRGEALGVRWQDVDLESSTLAVRQTLLADGGAPYFGMPKTKRGKRLIAIDLQTSGVLRKHRRRQAAEKLEAGSAYEDQGLVFANALGQPLHPDTVSKAFRLLVERAELPHIKLHGLRHTHATHALQVGIHPKVVSERLGHSTVALTLDIYSHAIPAMQQEAAELVAALIEDPNAGFR